MLEQMIEEMTGEFPALGRVFVKERDIYLANSLRKIAQPIPCPDAPDGKIPSVVVGVVGIGHVQGIKENWDKELDVDEICKLPTASVLSIITKVRMVEIMVYTHSVFVQVVAETTSPHFPVQAIMVPIPSENRKISHIHR
uniref:TraB domain-containing protein n=1 Tax=Biomphalaria glabrata TaxID=6526 RepID=A0A2C9LQK3_BIOGL